MSIVVATLVRAMIDPVLGNHLPFVTYFVAVMFSAWYSGRWPSWLALGFGYLASTYFFVPPRWSFAVAGLPNQIGIGLYFFVGIASILLSDAYRAAQRRAESGERELLEKQKVMEHEIAERKQAEDEVRRLNAELEQRVKKRMAELELLNDNLREETAERKRAEERIEDIMENVPVGIIVSTRDRGVIYVNSAVLKMFGYSKEEFLRLPPATHWYDPKDREKIYSEVGEKGFVRDFEAQNKRRDGSIFWVSSNVIALKTATAPSVLASVEDITERKKTETKLREYLGQIEAANKELESFSYSVSHDLRAPLRAIDGFSNILLEDYQNRLDDEVKRLLNVFRVNTKKMGQLIDDILHFSRIGRKEITITEIDMDKLVSDVYAEIKASAPERRLQFNVKPLPSAYGDPSMLRQVVSNLLSNAVKFTRQKASAMIEVGSPSPQSSPRLPSPLAGEGNGE
ncbi:MAG: DUF4118 domain-containing protein, partial [Deltaproteobacteria bacterium]|nr:DUF4118 domain-containing protein [Deltaproteobacteria bacterium]